MHLVYCVMIGRDEMSGFGCMEAVYSLEVVRQSYDLEIIFIDGKCTCVELEFGGS